MKMNRLALGLCLAAVAATAGAQTASRKTYIVELIDPPAATYEGGVAGLTATRPARGNRINASSRQVRDYVSHLEGKRQAVTRTVPGARVLHRYSMVLNGFAATLTDAEVARLAKNPRVKSIVPDEARKLDTSFTPTFLGLDQPGGAWSRFDANGRALKGENVIIGIVDSGVWPENTSVSDKVDTSTGKAVPSHTPLGGNIALAYGPLPAGKPWSGICQPGAAPTVAPLLPAANAGLVDMAFTAAKCNNKLIGARYYTAGVLAGGRLLWNTEFVSPRDESGHGSHTSATAGGNEGSSGTISGTFIPSFSGIAPRARLSAYKVCWTWNNNNVAQGNCFTSDSVAAIDQAVADGVDVINYSISGSTTSFVDPIETAFRRAAYAGVFVSASAGNSNVAGNAPTVAHLSPWIMTVGNSTHTRYTEATVTLAATGLAGQGASFQTAGVGPSTLTWSRIAGAAATQAAESSNQALCFGAADNVAPLLDPAKVAGKIIVCDRGGNVLVNKVANAKAAGAIGVIIQNTPVSASSTPLIVGVLPVVHLPVSAFTAVTTEALLGNGTGGKATISPSFQVAGVVAPVMAGTSSRGPNQGDLNMLKPDITAPGTDIISAYTNTDLSSPERDLVRTGALIPASGTNMISGTSMSSPHLAGMGALMKQANPTWSPAAIKSALMTSAQPIVKLASGAVDPTPWGYGAGHANPNAALSTTLVYDATPADFDKYVAKSISPWNLNMASITRANVVGPAPVTRTLTNTGAGQVTYNASTVSPPGFTVTVNPASLTIPAGGSASYVATITRTTAANEAWQFGSLTWSDVNNPSMTVRSPVQAKFTLFVGAPTVTDVRTTGGKVITVGTGWSGILNVTPSGMLAATRVAGKSVEGQPDVCFDIATPTGTQVIRVALFNADTQGGAASDIDLSLWRKTGANTRTAVGSSGSETSDEWVMVTSPTQSATFGYQACVNAYSPLNGSADFTLSYWVVGTPVGVQSLRAMGPPVAYVGGTAPIILSWNLAANQRYLGNVALRQTVGGTVIGNTPVYIDGVPNPSASGLPNPNDDGGWASYKQPK